MRKVDNGARRQDHYKPRRMVRRPPRCGDKEAGWDVERNEHTAAALLLLCRRGSDEAHERDGGAPAVQDAVREHGVPPTAEGRRGEEGCDARIGLDRRYAGSHGDGLGEGAAEMDALAHPREHVVQPLLLCEAAGEDIGQNVLISRWVVSLTPMLSRQVGGGGG